MTYIPPVSPVFDLAGEAYVPPAAAAFAFIDTSSDSVPMLTRSVRSAWARARPVDARAAGAGWLRTASADRQSRNAWGSGLRADLARGLPWDRLYRRDALAQADWGAANASDSVQPALPWSAVPVCDSGYGVAWDRSIRARNLRLRLLYNPAPPARDVLSRLRARRSNEYGPRYDAALALARSLYVPGSPLDFAFSGALYRPSTTPEVFFDFRYSAEAPPIQPTDMRPGRVAWQSARRLGQLLRLPWGRARVLDGALTGISYPDYPGPVVVLPDPPPDPERLDTYMIANTVTVVVLPARTPLEVRNLRISLDADSFSWSFSADIFTRAALDLVRPTADGATDLEVTINGWTWVLMVERYSRQRQFAREAYSISGATRTQLLAEPYAPQRTGLNAAAINARQVAEQQLLNTGFAIETWTTADWTFPAGAASYQSQTPMQVIARLAETVGAVLRPARTEDQLEVVPRYPLPPWQWETEEAPIAHIIPPEIYTQLGGEWTPQPDWNACYVSGTSHGVSMLVRRAGTAGDEPAPDVFDDWITGQEANQARGTHELSKGGNIEIVTLTLPLFHASDDKGVGLLSTATLLRVPEEGGESWVGLCLSVEISADGTGASRVQQQVKLERHHQWQQ